MAVLNLAIGKSKYIINCADGEEEKILSLSRKLNERVNNLSLAIRSADEKTILMLCALMVEEENQNLKSDYAANKVFNHKQDEKEKDDLEDELSEEIKDVASHIKKLIEKIRSIK